MELNNKKLLVLVADDYEDLELQYPRLRLLEAGAQVKIAGEKAQASYKGKHGYPCQADVCFDEIQADDFHGIIIPGGYAPDKLRTNKKVLELIQHFNRDRKLIAFICHAGWLPLSAGVLKGISCTSWASIKDDMINGGAKWVDQPVVVDQHFVSSRCPDDLPQFCPAVVKFLQAGR